VRMQIESVHDEAPLSPTRIDPCFTLSSVHCFILSTYRHDGFVNCLLLQTKPHAPTLLRYRVVIPHIQK